LARKAAKKMASKPIEHEDGETQKPIIRKDWVLLNPERKDQSGKKLQRESLGKLHCI